MEKMKFQRTTEEEEVFASLKIHTYIALGGMVIPSLRCVAINWQPDQEEAKLVFFHDGLVDEPINWHYNCIEVEATSMRHPLYKGEQIVMRLDQIFACPVPMMLSKASEVVYLRKESNLVFNEINHYIPQWHIDSVIRLKVNEALRGRVTGDLREIHLTWNETETQALIDFYHNGEIVEDTYRHYQDIFDIATATASRWKNKGKLVIPQLALKEVLYPKKIEKPKIFDRLYSRKEPFTDKPIGEE